MNSTLKYSFVIREALDLIIPVSVEVTTVTAMGLGVRDETVSACNL